MTIRFEKARHEDLRRIVEIYNQIIPSRLATADLEPLMTSDREAVSQFYANPSVMGCQKRCR